MKIKEPIDTIKDWQKQFRMIAEIDEPGQTKESRENLHNTSKTFASMTEAELKAHIQKKLFNAFADTITEGLCETSPGEVYSLFLKALEDNLEYTKTEYKKSLELYQLATGKSTKENNG